MSKSTLWAAMLGCLLVAPACNRQERAPVTREEPRGVPPSPTNTTPPTTEKAAQQDSEAAKVLAILHQDDQNEIELGKLAQTHAGSKAAKTFGKMLIDDHTAADKKIMAYVKEHDVVLDQGDAVKKADDKAKAGREAMEKLGKLKGAAFDKEFATIMTKGHEEAIDLVKNAQKDVKDSKLQALLADLQPTLEKHLEHAKMIEEGATASKAEGSKRAQGRRAAR
jgi:predicted outer membrane protein